MVFGCIWHGFGTSEDFYDGVSQVFVLFALGRCGVLSFPHRFLEAFARRKQTRGSFLSVQSQCAKCLQGKGHHHHPPPTHPISCVASHMSHARNVIIPTPPIHPIKGVASNMCARATQQLRSVSHVCTCKERHHPPPHQPSPTPQHAIQ